MNYPNDFDTPAFPAGKSIAWARVVSIKILIFFFLIICACGVLLFFVKAKQNYPFLISVDPLTDEWSVITYPGRDKERKIEQYQIIQEKIVSDFVTNWFTISTNQFENAMRWKKCTVDECGDPQQYNPQNVNCTLFCTSNEKLFEQFAAKVAPEYSARIAQASETWTIKKRDIVPYVVNVSASAWQVYIKIHSSISGDFDVLTFVKVARDPETHPATLGYYIEDFNAYRMQP